VHRDYVKVFKVFTAQDKPIKDIGQTSGGFPGRFFGEGGLVLGVMLGRPFFFSALRPQ
jgi:hypothetical protein